METVPKGRENELPPISLNSGSMESLHHHIAEFRAKHPECLEGRILVAVSGGPDSIALAHILHTEGCRISIAHVNYHLRPESDAEEALVKRFAEELDVPCHLLSLPKSESKAAGDSTQVLARQARYAFFESLLEEHSYTACATAHHQGDQVETLLFSMLRGGHPGQLKGIPALRPPFIRPLLQATRAEIDAYIATHELPFATDSSNLQRDYLRNRIRLDVLPALQTINPSASQRILEHWEAGKGRDRLLEHLLTPILNRAVGEEEGDRHLDLGKLDLPKDQLPTLVTVWMQGEGFWGNEILEAVKLLARGPGAAMEFRGRKILRTKSGLLIRSGERLRYENNRQSEIALPNPLPRFHEASTPHRRIKFQRLKEMPDSLRPPPGIHWMDSEALQPPLRIRTWKQGDRMRPLGMSGSKLLSDILAEMGTHLLERQQTLVFADAQGPFLVEGYRIADRVKVQAETREILQVGIEKIVNEPPNHDVQEES